MYKKYRDRGVKFFYVYTREPHPGMYQHAQTQSLEERKKYAKEVREELCFDLPIIFDDMQGTIQKAYGNRPNAGFLISKEGVVLQKQGWADPEALERELERLLSSDASADLSEQQK